MINTSGLKLYNGSAVCSMMMGSYDDAERDLLEAIASQDARSRHLGKLGGVYAFGKSSGRFINAMKQTGVAHDALARLAL